MNEQIDGETDRQLDRLMDGWMDRWMELTEPGRANVPFNSVLLAVRDSWGRTTSWGVSLGLALI